MKASIFAIIAAIFVSGCSLGQAAGRAAIGSAETAAIVLDWYCMLPEDRREKVSTATDQISEHDIVIYCDGDSENVED